MKSALTLLFTMGIFSISTAQAAIVCEGPAPLGGTLKLTLSEDQSAQVEVIDSDGNTAFQRDFARVDYFYGGQTLITAHGLSVTFANAFGCIRRATITTEFRPGKIDSVEIPLCHGGETPDDLCGF